MQAPTAVRYFQHKLLYASFTFYSALEPLAMMRHINLRFTMHYTSTMQITAAR